MHEGILHNPHICIMVYCRLLVQRLDKCISHVKHLIRHILQVKAIQIMHLIKRMHLITSCINNQILWYFKWTCSCPESPTTREVLQLQVWSISSLCPESPTAREGSTAEGLINQQWLQTYVNKIYRQLMGAPSRRVQQQSHSKTMVPKYVSTLTEQLPIVAWYISGEGTGMSYALSLL